MIELQENTGIKNIKRLYEQLKSELNSSDEVLIDFSRVGRVDLSVLQVLISMGRYARDSGKTVKLKAVSDQIKMDMQICGIKT